MLPSHVVAGVRTVTTLELARRPKTVAPFRFKVPNPHNHRSSRDSKPVHFNVLPQIPSDISLPAVHFSAILCTTEALRTCTSRACALPMNKRTGGTMTKRRKRMRESLGSREVYPEQAIQPRYASTVDVRSKVEQQFTLMEEAHDRIRAHELATRLRGRTDGRGYLL